MKIVKVVHQVDPSSIKKEQEYSLFRNYKIHHYITNNIDVFIKEFDSTEEKLRNIFYDVSNKEIKKDNNAISILQVVNKWSKVIPYVGTELIFLEELFKHIGKDKFNARKKSVIEDWLLKCSLFILIKIHTTKF